MEKTKKCEEEMGKRTRNRKKKMYEDSVKEIKRTKKKIATKIRTSVISDED